jgi:pimeloyl-ACP methyl ester carboxylesterase
MAERTVLYLHGLASSPAGRKRALLEEALAPEGIAVVAPDLNLPSFERLDFDRIVRGAAAAAADLRPAVVVGSSLGALVALALAHDAGPTGPPLVLVAPALAFGERWRDRLSDGEDVEIHHHGEGRPLPIHREFFLGMASLRVEDAPPPVPVTIVMGTADESVPFAQVEATWGRWELSKDLAPGSRFVSIAGGDHSLLASGAQIAAAVRELLATRKT